MDVREQRGQEIAARARIEKKGDAWVVPSQSGSGSYRVQLGENGEPQCTCPDFELRGRTCKHGFAVEMVIQRETVTETTVNGVTKKTTVIETARVTYAQNWPAYNQAQTQEKALFRRLLHDLCATVPEPVQEQGRPRIPMADALFSACFKVYSTVSTRRFMTDLRDAHADGLISHPWHYNTVCKVIEDETLTPILYDLVTASATPVAAIEQTFAVDSTGFGTQCFYRHFTAKYGREIDSHDWIKLHAIVGTNTNVIAAARITDRNANDSPHFTPLVLKSADYFRMNEIVADKAYGSRRNVALTATVGATPYIALKSNAGVSSARAFNSTTRDSTAWRWLYHLYNLRRDDFLVRYHQRSNVESTFSSMKRVFGDTLRSKTRDAQINELLLKVIAYNIVCLVHSIFELGIEVPNFQVKGAA